MEHDFESALRKPQLSEVEAKLAAIMLRKASAEFSEHGCNDLDLVNDMGLTEKESFELRKAMHRWNADPLADPPSESQHSTADYAVMSYLAARIEGKV